VGSLPEVVGRAGVMNAFLTSSTVSQPGNERHDMTNEPTDLIAFYNEPVEIEGEILRAYDWLDTIAHKMLGIASELHRLAAMIGESAPDSDTMREGGQRILSDTDYAMALAHAIGLPVDERRQMLPPLLRVENCLGVMIGTAAREADSERLAAAIVEADRAAHDPLVDSAMGLLALSQVYELEGWGSGPPVRLGVSIPDPVGVAELARLVGYPERNGSNKVSRAVREAGLRVFQKKKPGKAVPQKWLASSGGRGEHGKSVSHEALRYIYPGLLGKNKLKTFLQTQGFDKA
jgi:hypothetical protein